MLDMLEKFKGFITGNANISLCILLVVYFVNMQLLFFAPDFFYS